MKKASLVASLLLLLPLLPGPAAEAGVETQTRPALKTAAPPLDVAVTADGRRSFVLSEGGLVTIYSWNGSIIDTLKVDPAMDRLSTDGEGGQLILTSHRDSTVSQLLLDFQAELDYSDSPFLGKADAPVVMAVFSDFQ